MGIARSSRVMACMWLGDDVQNIHFFINAVRVCQKITFLYQSNALLFASG